MFRKFTIPLFAILFLLHSPLFAEKVFREITVQKGETLAIIAKKHLENPDRWKELLQYNKIETPNLIYPGMKIKIPDFLSRAPVAVVLGNRNTMIKTEDVSSRWEPATPNQKLFIGDSIKTEKSGYARIAYRTGITINIDPGSELVLNGDGKLQSQESGGVFLKNGFIESIVSKKDGKTNPYYVRTPTAVASVRGTVFATKQDVSGNLTVTCEKGLVAVEAGGKSVTLHEKEGTMVEPGGTPLEPVQLPLPPQIHTGT